jgi:hypothetical protein
MNVWNSSPVDDHMRVDEHELTAGIENPLVRVDCQLRHSSTLHTEL